MLLSLPAGTKMFQFPTFASVVPTDVGIAPYGLPHSDICGSRCICHSPQLFAACHVLLRLREPRHPSCALLSFPLTVISGGRPPSISFRLVLNFESRLVFCSDRGLASRPFVTFDLLVFCLRDFRHSDFASNMSMYSFSFRNPDPSDIIMNYEL